MRFVNVQVTFSALARATDSVAPAKLAVVLVPPVQLAPVRVNPVMADSVKVKLPAARLPKAMSQALPALRVNPPFVRPVSPVPVAVKTADDGMPVVITLPFWSVQRFTMVRRAVPVLG
jgi:hypothetical protein